MNGIQYYITRIKNFVGLKTHDEQIFESNRNKKIVLKVITWLRRAIIYSLIVFSVFILYNSVMRDKNTTPRMVELKPSVFRPKFPYDDFDDMLSLLKRCVSPTQDNIHEIRDLVTIRRNQEEWVVMNITLLFLYLEDVIKDYESIGMYTYCSIMLGIDDIPCACASKMRDGSIQWILDIIEPGPIDDFSNRQIAIVKEVSYLFSKMDDIVIHRYVPKEQDVLYAKCEIKKGFSCSYTRDILYGEDVFVFFRSAYFLRFDPLKYTNIHPHFGSFNTVVKKDQIV